VKFIRVDMTKAKVTVEETASKYEGLGGRGLTSAMINAEVPAGCDPLGPENKLIFAPGLLTGTPLVNTSRISIGAKSPLTGGIKESNVGGTLPATLGRYGVAAVVIEGRPSAGELHILHLDENGTPRLVPAHPYRRLRTYALAKVLFETFGEKNGILCIGPAGEEGYSSASIQSTDVDNRPCRAAGRGGLGAVMGAKGLKAFIVAPPKSAPKDLGNAQAFMDLARAYAKVLKEHPLTGKALPSLGTAVSVSTINNAGAFSSFNATKGVFEGWEKISGEQMAETIKGRGGVVGHMGCSQCVIHCSNVFVDSRGGYVTSSLEYETIWSMGGMCGIDDLDTIARLDFLCDDLGVDTINTGVAMAVAMDAGYRRFGDGRAAVEMMEELARGSDVGRVFGDGPVAVGKHFNHKRVPHAKNQAVSGYDARALQGMGVTYATSPMGADHTAGYVVSENLGGMVDRFRPERQVETSRNAQVRTAFMDCTGLCQFATSAVKNNREGEEAILKMVNLRHGTNLAYGDIQTVGLSVLKAERDFNRRAGLTNKDDRLSEMFYKEPLPPHNKTVLVSDEEMDGTFDF
jgi:aldehyde:ferredoxin oxidoreductase